MNTVRALLHDVLPFDPPMEAVLTTNLPETVCTIVVAFAANRQSLRLPPQLDRKVDEVQWRAVRPAGVKEVALILEEGPLHTCVMQFTFRPLRSGVFSCWLNGGYVPKERKLYGALEDFAVRRTAHKIRANVLETIKYCLEAVGSKSGAEMRQSERRPMKGSLRMRAGGRSLIAQLLNVSERGLGVAISCAPVESDGLAQFLTAQKVLEAEMIDPRLARAFQVSAQHRQLVPGGLMVGLQVHDPASIAPLVQRAFLRS